MGKKPARSEKTSSQAGVPRSAPKEEPPGDMDLFETGISYRANRYDTFEFSSKVTCFAFSSDAPLLAVGVELGGVYLFDLTQPEASVAAPSELIAIAWEKHDDSGSHVPALCLLTGVVKSMSFGPQNGFGEQILYGAFDDGYVRRWLIRNMSEMIQIDCLYFGQEIQRLLVSSAGRSVIVAGRQSRLAVWSALYDNCFSYLSVPWLWEQDPVLHDAILLPDVLLHPKAPPNADVCYVAAASPTEGILIFNVVVVEPQYTHHFDVSVLPVRALPGAFSKMTAIPLHINEQHVVVLAVTAADATNQVAVINLQPDAENYPGCRIHATLMEIDAKPGHAITAVHWVTSPEEVRSLLQGEPSPGPHIPPPRLPPYLDSVTQQAPNPYTRAMLCVGTDKGSIFFLECTHVPDKSAAHQRLRVRLVFDLDGNRGAVWLQDVPPEIVMGRRVFASCCNDTMCHLWELQEVQPASSVDAANAHAAQRCAYLEMLRHRCMPDNALGSLDSPFPYFVEPSWPVEPRATTGIECFPHQGARFPYGFPGPFRHNRHEGKTTCMHRSLKQTAADRQRLQIASGVDPVVDDVLNRVCKDISLWEQQQRDGRLGTGFQRQLSKSSSRQRDRLVRTSSDRRESSIANDRPPWNDRFHVK
ncbi:hypothetical protein CSUI_004179 [Cystoisospora suis]|uniref:Uncharacterized protein n=1 Tax=Cystoisospora suis TaxID=483139 RepID=A0A2C6KNB3_9APIC|nr:hypothetical protein CSUI_004179 [Cystoisospora suis]